jgi:hypothetical protein
MRAQRPSLDPLGFLQLCDQPPEVSLLRRWLDSWAGMGDVVAGLTRPGLDVELRQRPGRMACAYPSQGLFYSILIAAATESTHGRRMEREWACLGARATPMLTGGGPRP